MSSFTASIIFLLLAVWSPQIFFLSARKSTNARYKDRAKLDETDRNSVSRRSGRPVLRASSNRVGKTKKKVDRHLFDVMRDKISGVKRKGYKYYLEIMANGSSEFECACIKATRPNNDPPKEKYVSSIIAAVNNFDDINVDSSTIGDDFDPYQVALHKIWFRIANKRDFRTKLKALYILHRLWSSVQLESAVLLKKQMIFLSSKTCSRTGKFYFGDDEAAHTSSCPPDHSHYDFLRMYSKYVLFRCKEFSSSFEESIIGFQSFSLYLNHEENVGKSRKLLVSKYKMKVEQLNDILSKMKKALSIISSYFITVSCVDEISSICFSLLKKDFQQLYTLFEERLAELIAIYEISHPDKNKREKIESPEIIEITESSSKLTKEQKNLKKFCEFYTKISKSIVRWNSHHSKMFKNYTDNDYDGDTVKYLSLNKFIDNFYFSNL